MDQGFRLRSQRFDVSKLGIKCAECDADIKELPFEPKLREEGGYGKIYCSDCMKKRYRRFNRGPRRF